MRAEERAGEQGFLLLGLIVAIFLMLLALSVAAPKVARELRREREVETVRRGNQYVRAIQLYYRKFGHYPGSMDQLEKTNNIRFLRQDYVDPMTGKVDWRVIKVGENKTTVKGFFGKPLAGLTGGGLGSGGSPIGATGSGAMGSAFGNSGTSGSSMGGSSFGSTSGGFSLGGSSSTGTVGSGNASAPGGSSGMSSSNFAGNQGPVMGVGLAKEGDSIITLNEQTTYNTWEFIYDPRIEQLKAKGALMGGSGLGSSGTGSGSVSGFGSGTSGGMGFGSSTPSTGTGTNAPGPGSNPQ